MSPLPGGDIGDLTDAVTEATMVSSARERRRSTVSADRRSAWISGGTLILVATTWPALAWPADVPVAAIVGCIAVFALAASIEFEIGPGSAVPTTPVLMLALFLCPPALVPAVVLAGLVVSDLLARLHEPDRRDGPLVLACSAWHAVGPAMVVARWAPADSFTEALPVVAAALAAQIAFDFASTLYRTSYGLGVPVRRLGQAYRLTILVDILLAPIGVAAAFALPGSVGALALVIPPIAILDLLQRDRRRVIDRTLLLGQAVTETNERARTDVLTGLRNRLAWEERLAQLTTQEAGPVGIVMLDVDGLKRANDLFGHEAGDRLLAAVGEIVARHRPDHDDALAARLGGDEFGVLLTGDLATEAQGVAGRIAEALAVAPHLDGMIPVSASVGCAIATRGSQLADGLDRADRAVYEDKTRRRMHRDQLDGT